MKILLTTHGNLCASLVKSLKMIVGDNKNISTIELDEEGIGDFRKRIDNWFLLNEKEKILILCDIKGGTPYNESFLKLLKNEENIRLITGVNLPMLIELSLMDDSIEDLDQIEEMIISAGKESIEKTTIDIEEETDLF